MKNAIEVLVRRLISSYHRLNMLHCTCLQFLNFKPKKELNSHELTQVGLQETDPNSPPQTRKYTLRQLTAENQEESYLKQN